MSSEEASGDHKRVPSLALLNCAIAKAPGVYTLTKITVEQARALCQEHPTESYIGHSATAEVMSSDLGIPVEVRRADYLQQPGDRAIVLSMRTRATKEAEILDVAAMRARGFDYLVLERQE